MSSRSSVAVPGNTPYEGVRLSQSAFAAKPRSQTGICREDVNGLPSLFSSACSSDILTFEDISETGGCHFDVQSTYAPEVPVSELESSRMGSLVVVPPQNSGSESRLEGSFYPCLTSSEFGVTARENSATGSKDTATSRKRIACVACARSKSRCNKADPKCARCIEKGILCHFRFGAVSRVRNLRINESTSDPNSPSSVGSTPSPRAGARANLARVQRRVRSPAQRLNDGRGIRVLTTPPTAVIGKGAVPTVWKRSQPNTFVSSRSEPLDSSPLSASSSDGMPMTPQHSSYSVRASVPVGSYVISPPASPDTLAAQSMLFDELMNDMYVKATDSLPETHESLQNTSVVDSFVSGLATPMDGIISHNVGDVNVWPGSGTSEPGCDPKSIVDMMSLNRPTTTESATANGTNLIAPNQDPLPTTVLTANMVTNTFFPEGERVAPQIASRYMWQDDHYTLPGGGCDADHLTLQESAPGPVPDPVSDLLYRYCLLDNYFTAVHGPNYAESLDILLSNNGVVSPYSSSISSSGATTPNVQLLPGLRDLHLQQNQFWNSAGEAFERA